MKKTIFIFASAFCVLASAQSYQWAKGIGGPVNVGSVENDARSVTTDAVGNVYVAGCFQGTAINFNPGMGSIPLSSGPGASDIFFAKYAAAGTCTWAKGIPGSAGRGESITTDAAGNVYVTGTFSGANVDFDPGPGVAILNMAGVFDIFFAKYDANGNYLWAKAIGGSNLDISMFISLDAMGNAYITGRFNSANVDFDPGPGVAALSTAGVSDIFLAKYDASGNYLWAKSVGGPANEQSFSLSTDAAGNAYITGNFQSSNVDFDPGPGIAVLSSAGTDIFFAKYDANGNYLWAKSVSGSGGAGRGISADAAGNTWITGSFQGSNLDFDPGPGTAFLNAAGSGLFFANYDANGNYLWAKSVVNASGFGISKNASGKVYVTGTFSGTNVDFDTGPGTAVLSSAGTDIFFAKYDAAGNYIWAKAIATPSIDYARAIAADGSDNVYIAGAFSGSNVDFDPGPGSAALNTGGNYYLYLAKYALCSTQALNPQAICTGKGYAVNGHTYTASGIYNDTLHTAFGCDSLVVTQLTVSNQQTVTISSSSVLCSGSSNTLIAAGAVTYTWSTGAQTPSIVITPTAVTPYVVSGTGTIGCTGSDTINVMPTPTLGISSKPAICKGEAITITATGANNYTWSTGAQTPGISTTLTTTTIYTVTGSLTNNPCKDQQTVTVIVNPCLGIFSMANEDIQTIIYPNPAKTELFYTVNNSGLHKYTLTDPSGRILAENEQRGSKGRLDLSLYQPGLYILTITVGKASESMKFLIE